MQDEIRPRGHRDEVPLLGALRRRFERAVAALSVIVGGVTWLTAAVVILYTASGGLQAVVYTDTVQWIILFLGLIGLGIPLGYAAVGVLWLTVLIDLRAPNAQS